jgi:hypothetical protein
MKQSDFEKYFNKYRKYKYKYLKLKQKGGELFTDNNTNLYLKFITEKLIALLDTENIISVSGGNGKRKNDIPIDEDTDDVPDYKIKKPSTRIKLQPVKYKDYIQDLTPAILEYLTPISKAVMEDDIEIDNEIITKLKEMQEKEDDDYILYESNYGKLIECWIADNMNCPCCDAVQSLRRYSSPSMPVIDLVCINPEHNLSHGVKFFQVKASNGSLFLDKPYFNYDTNLTNPNANTIHVGSRKLGEMVHTINPQRPIFIKKILCGYICINYNENEDNLVINLSKSFIVLPNYLLSDTTTKRKLSFEPIIPTIETDCDWYYKYIETNNTHNRIMFNIKTNNILLNDDIKKLIPSQSIQKSYVIKSTNMYNPLSILELD